MDFNTEIGICMLILAGVVYYIKKHPRVLPTSDIIKKYGYACETHYITTDDGYILTCFRIPNNTSKGSVLVFHGLLGSSATFVQYGPERGLAFILADAGYDVWLSNIRGTQLSLNHTKYHPSRDSEKFYNFSMHEIGYYDIPNSIDYILKETGDTSLYYVGFSMGTAVYFIFASTRPEYQSKVRLASLLSPVAKLEHYPRWSFYKNMAELVYVLEKLKNILHIHKLPSTGLMREILPTICNIPGMLSILQQLFVLFSGKKIYIPINKKRTSETIHTVLSLAKKFVISRAIHLLTITTWWLKELLRSNKQTFWQVKLIPIVAANSPSNTAIKILCHWGQSIKNGGFRRYDYGTKQNLQIYGQKSPPSYNLSAIKTPLAIYYGNKDTMAPLKDTKNLVRELKTTAVGYLIPSSKFCHASFICSSNLKNLLFDKMLEVMNQH